jgi:cell division protein FtsQ
MDARVADRRRGVSEDKARRRLRWILVLMIVLLVSGAAIWLIRSPLLSISRVDITGVVMSDPVEPITELAMGVGRPTIDIDSGALERAIERDPWVADASVSVVWPGTLVVDIVEHRAVAPVKAADRWMLAAVGGAVIVDAGDPGPGPLVDIDLDGTGPGAMTTDRRIIGALAFIDAIAIDLRDGLRISADGDSLTAAVDGHIVRLGRPVDMAMKAAVLESLIGQGLEPGASVDLIAPTRPAVRNPPSQQEVEE